LWLFCFCHGVLGVFFAHWAFLYFGRNIYIYIYIYSTYILSLMLFIIGNKQDFFTNAHVHGLDTRNKIIYICL
jgi:hypothetical protein